LGTLAAPNRPTVIVALNGNAVEFDFINWRVVSYYMDQSPLTVLMDDQPKDGDDRIRLVRGRDVRFLPQETIVLPKAARVLWIMQPDGRFHRALQRVIPVNRGRYILYSDLTPDVGSFEIEGFRFTQQ
jgi:hypothetical protein